ncbi:MAG: RagB/SusD family nutrient uptake outer membrane protein [Staphylococcus sp.]|nr:RagB/SusD family nutrient uptake outer membrane protein [Staphylococcus sp.]
MKSYKFLGLALLASFSLSGCSDFLDADNKTNADQNGEDYFKENPDQILTASYYCFKDIATMIELTDQGADLYINARGADDGTYSLYNLNAEDGKVSDLYKKAYNAINYANAVIKYANDSKLVGEATFLRNWGYYYLTQQFGSVPYVTNYIESATRDYPRTPLAEMYPAMLEDLTNAYNNAGLPNTDHTGHASKQAIAALAAKVALAAAWDLGTTMTDEVRGTYTVTNTDMFKTAADWAEKAINGVQLTMSFADKWSPSNEGNAEEIFSVQYDRAGFPGNVSTGGHSLMYDYMGYYGNCVATGHKGTKSGGTNSVSYKAMELFERGDQRYEGTFMTTNYNSTVTGSTAVWGTEGYLAYWNLSADKLAEQPISVKFYPSYTTDEEVLADLAAHSTQTKKFPTNTMGNNLPFACVMNSDNVSIWYFNTDGSIQPKQTKSTAEFIKAGFGSSPCVKKWDDPQSECVTASNCYRDIVIFHVSDMYLIAAEAYLLAGQEANALAKVNAVRNRAGLANLASFGAYEAPYTVTSGWTATPLDLILDERARELYAERTRWEDLRRTRQLVRYNIEFARSIDNVADMQNSKGETKWYRPIPATEINNNTSMTLEDQNPGY